eukprot:m.28814 g.28814  ORF g.28814 m.28814 type:complete len:1719 (+) comp11885_c0_seq1:33-5189(+)
MDSQRVWAMASFLGLVYLSLAAATAVPNACYVINDAQFRSCLSDSIATELIIVTNTSEIRLTADLTINASHLDRFELKADPRLLTGTFFQSNTTITIANIPNVRIQPLLFRGPLVARNISNLQLASLSMDVPGQTALTLISSNATIDGLLITQARRGVEVQTSSDMVVNVENSLLINDADVGILTSGSNTSIHLGNVKLSNITTTGLWVNGSDMRVALQAFECDGCQGNGIVVQGDALHVTLADTLTCSHLGPGFCLRAIGEANQILIQGDTAVSTMPNALITIATKEAVCQSGIISVSGQHATLQYQAIVGSNLECGLVMAGRAHKLSATNITLANVSHYGMRSVADESALEVSAMQCDACLGYGVYLSGTTINLTSDGIECTSMGQQSICVSAKGSFIQLSVPLIQAQGTSTVDVSQYNSSIPLSDPLPCRSSGVRAIGSHFDFPASIAIQASNLDCGLEVLTNSTAVNLTVNVTNVTMGLHMHGSNISSMQQTTIAALNVIMGAMIRVDNSQGQPAPLAIALVHSIGHSGLVVAFSIALQLDTALYTDQVSFGSYVYRSGYRASRRMQAPQLLTSLHLVFLNNSLVNSATVALLVESSEVVLDGSNLTSLDANTGVQILDAAVDMQLHTLQLERTKGSGLVADTSWVQLQGQMIQFDTEDHGLLNTNCTWRTTSSSSIHLKGVSSGVWMSGGTATWNGNYTFQGTVLTECTIFRNYAFRLTFNHQATFMPAFQAAISSEWGFDVSSADISLGGNWTMSAQCRGLSLLNTSLRCDDELYVRIQGASDAAFLLVDGANSKIAGTFRVSDSGPFEIQGTNNVTIHGVMELDSQLVLLESTQVCLGCLLPLNIDGIGYRKAIYIQSCSTVRLGEQVRGTFGWSSIRSGIWVFRSSNVNVSGTYDMVDRQALLIDESSNVNIINFSILSSRLQSTSRSSHITVENSTDIVFGSKTNITATSRQALPRVDAVSILSSNYVTLAGAITANHSWDGVYISKSSFVTVSGTAILSFRDLSDPATGSAGIFIELSSNIAMAPKSQLAVERADRWVHVKSCAGVELRGTYTGNQCTEHVRTSFSTDAILSGSWTSDSFSCSMSSSGVIVESFHLQTTGTVNWTIDGMPISISQSSIECPRMNLQVQPFPLEIQYSRMAIPTITMTGVAIHLEHTQVRTRDFEVTASNTFSLGCASIIEGSNRQGSGLTLRDSQSAQIGGGRERNCDVNISGFSTCLTLRSSEATVLENINIMDCARPLVVDSESTATTIGQCESDSFGVAVSNFTDPIVVNGSKTVIGNLQVTLDDSQRPSTMIQTADTNPDIGISLDGAVCPIGVTIHQQDSSQQDSSQNVKQKGNGSLVAGVVAGAIAVTAIAAIAALVIRRRNQRVGFQSDNLSVDPEMRKQVLLDLASRFDSVPSIVPRSKAIAVRDISEPVRQLGRGAFGEVYLCTYKPQASRSEPQEVAVKTSKLANVLEMFVNPEECKQKTRIFLLEGHLMLWLNHPHLVTAVGIQDTTHPIQLVLEYCQHGDLLHFLRKSPIYACEQPTLAHTDICRQLARACKYLHSIDLIHRDLAARNALVAGQDDTMICGWCVKLTDLGMARGIASMQDYYKKHGDDAIPVRWQDPQAIVTHKYTKASDVYSFGVLMWEVYSGGQIPFEELSAVEVIRAVSAGHRLNKPSEDMFDEAFDLLRTCTLANSSQRPTIAQACDTLADLCQANETETSL